MLLRRLTRTTLRHFPMLALAAALPMVAMANSGSSSSVPMVAQLAEDENVEDVIRSEPRRSRAAEQPTTASVADSSAADEEPPAADAEPESKSESESEVEQVVVPIARKIAPNIDLKEVAPLPEPEPEEIPSAELSEQETLEQPSVADEEAPSEPLVDEPQEPVPAESFTLLGKEVLPGTSTRLAWSPQIQIAGLSQITPVLVVNGVNTGPTLCLTGAIHGDELNGIEIVRRAMYDLDPEKLSGRVIGVPIVNLTGFQQGSRYLPDRRDLNRYFPGRKEGNLADRVAYSLFENVIRHCDMLVDIHTGSLKRTNLPQLRADMNNPDVAEFTRGFDRMAVVHSSGSPGMLRTSAVDAGIRAVTMEAGESLRIQEHQIDAGVNSLNSLMEKHGMISRMFVWGDPEPVYYDSTWVRAEHGGILFSEIDLGANVSEGEVLGYVADPITNEQHPIRSTSNGRIIGMAVDQVVMAGFAAYHIGTEAEVPGE